VDDAPYLDDLDLASVTTREELATLLQTVRLRAGKPSLRTLEARARHSATPLSKTVVAEMLRGTRLPRKAVMIAFLRACEIPDDRMEPWYRAWERVAVRGSGPASLSVSYRQPISHRQLLERTLPGIQPPGRADLDAIIVPASRPAANLDHAITVARAADCPLVVICNGQLHAAEVNELFAYRSFSSGAIVDVPPGYDHPLLRFASSDVMRDEPQFASPSGDLSTKRNLGLLLARMLGWRRIFFLDDDIRDVTIPDLNATVSMLDQYRSAGMSISNFYDYSVIEEADRMTGGLQDSFVSASALVVNCAAGPVGFFPNIYKEGWLFFYEDISRRQLASSDGEATQLGYDPFGNTELAARQEFGEIMTGGLYALLHQNLGAEHATRDYWRDFLSARIRFLEAIRARADMAEPKSRKRMLNSVEAALKCSTHIQPEFCERYVQLWRQDLRRWEVTLEEIPQVPSILTALRSLDFAPAGEGSGTGQAPTIFELSRAAADQAQDADSPAEVLSADQAESEARMALAQLAFDEAARLLRSAIALDPGRAARLQPDLNWLSEQPGDSPSRLVWRRCLWLALAAGSPLQPPEPEPESDHDDTVQVLPGPAIATAPISPSREQLRRSRKPQKAGEDLEIAFVRLMERFFSLTADDKTRMVEKLRLRRQSAGTQFGHDVQFDCTTVANKVVRCHVECKNYTRELKTADVAEKILQTPTYWQGKELDYFLIVTPLAGISNDLDHYIQTANSRGDHPFRIQAWGPEEGIEEFFAIEPSAYRAVYGTEPSPVPDVAAVVARWADKLKPVIRLPSPLKGYLANTRMHSLGGEDHAHFNALLGESIEVDAVNPAGSPLGRLSDVLAGWIDDPARRRFLLLGEFGDGKSFACYRLIRWLAGKYLDDPSSCYFPLRLPLRDLVKAGNPQELLARRLQTLGADMRDWAIVQDISPTLVVLDGFDEMSGQLDHDTVRNNLSLLGECVEYFNESKILVTSRTHFFESTRMQARFLEKLEDRSWPGWRRCC
jgi:hypothetical protein